MPGSKRAFPVQASLIASFGSFKAAESRSEPERRGMALANGRGGKPINSDGQVK